MQSKRWGLVFFVLGIFSMHVPVTLSFVWALAGIPLAYPLPVNEGPLFILSGYGLPIGAVLMVIGGLIYGRKPKEVIK